MAVPSFQDMMLPLLQFAADGREHTSSEAIEFLAQQFRLSDAEQREVLPSGKQSRFVNRVGWAATYLRKTKLLDGTGKGRFRITDRGRSELQSPPPGSTCAIWRNTPNSPSFAEKDSRTILEM